MCFFLDASPTKQRWPLSGEALSAHAKDVGLFESLSAINERFGKLQDTLGSAMRHAALLAGEEQNTFLRTLAFYEKIFDQEFIDLTGQVAVAPDSEGRGSR